MKKNIKENPTLAIIIPTYNESENIESLTRSIQKNTSPTDLIFIVDDNSPDKTGKVADKISKKAKNVIVIHRKTKSGRGSAGLDGFRAAEKYNPAFFIEMDADSSHNPEDIPKLLSKIREGFGIVIGSRYLKESQIKNWPLQRKIFSKFANLFAKAILNVPISDYTNGFRIYSKEA